MRIGLVGVAKNESDIIAEWIGFHALMGFTDIYIYNNQSEDATLEIARCAALEVNIKTIDWPSNNVSYQSDAYKDAVINYGSSLDWMAFIDLDEFIITGDGSSVVPFLTRLAGAQAIALNWALYGSAGHLSRSAGLITESYLRRAVDGFPPNCHVKSIIKPSAFTGAINPHVMAPQNLYVDPLGNPVDWKSDGLSKSTNGMNVIRVNHYFVRSKEEWALKRARGHRGAERTAEEFSYYDRNEIYDPIAQPIGRKARQKYDFITRPAVNQLPHFEPQLPVDFAPEVYLLLNEDVRLAGFDPIDHYIACGLKEGRAYKR